jgi:two-component system heavy metal sensor histidine kinase CusS
VALVNRSLFGRACTNLLMNAIQHCAPHDTVRVTIAREEDQVRIAVGNPGPPIDPSTLDHLFDRFYRAEESRTNSRENHGLGLAIVKAIAEMHRGTVSVESADGVNTFAFSVDASRIDLQGVRETAVTVERNVSGVGSASCINGAHKVTAEPAPAGRMTM